MKARRLWAPTSSCEPIYNLFMPTAVVLARIHTTTSLLIASYSVTRSVASFSTFTSYIIPPPTPSSSGDFASRFLRSHQQFPLFSSPQNEEAIEPSSFPKQKQSTLPLTMADDILNSEENSINPLFSNQPSFSCPGCSFLSYNDLFLPSTEKKEETDDKAFPNNEGGDGEEIMSPHNALEQITAASEGKEKEDEISKDEKQRKQHILLVDTHGHPHLNRGRQADYIEQDDDENTKNTSVIRLSCAVSESDWAQTLEYASQSKSILPALGVHPWYLSDLSPDYLSNLEALLEQHPNAIVGEIGLCKVAKFIRTYEQGKTAALELQRRVFKEQLELAVKLNRPVSVHCVQQHGVFMSLLKEMREEAKIRMAKEKKNANSDDDGKGEKVACSSSSQYCLADAFPPKIGMHSFTGTAHHVGELLAFEDSLYESTTSGRGRKSKKKKKKGKDKEAGKINDEAQEEENITQQPPTPPPRKPIFYFGFSHSINVLMCSSSKSRIQGMDAIRAVPTNRLLAESDVHSHDDVPAATAGSVAYIAKAIDADLVETAELTALNGFEFLGVGGPKKMQQQQQQQQ